MDHQLDRKITFDPVSPLEFIYQQISVDAIIEKTLPGRKCLFKNKQKIHKRILKQCSGKFSPNTMTAILGPSGSGKTTMLNLLSGRLISNNLILRGRIKINGRQISTMHDFKQVIGYVMQEDLMLPTFTPRETFRFITDMRLPFKTDQEKDAIVQSMIESLGLTKCSETYVGNSLIRGLSGGEKKRTSVGVELLINPSLIFLDEPTTGLDSTTALNLVRFLNRLANAGRTVVTTIHQPSSEIFLEFDKILLMLDGHVVYNNDAKSSMDYFRNLGLPVPLRSNPMQHYMKLMNKQGISLRYIGQGITVTDQQVNHQFTQRVNYLVQSYNSQTQFPQPVYTNQIVKQGHQSSWCRQCMLIFKRSTINELRNPLGIKTKIGQIIFFAIITIILYQRASSTLDSYLQNISGLIFFIVMNVGFSAIFASINIFSQERGVFIRERLCNTYRTSSYYVGRSLTYIPLQLFLPFLLLVISYWVVHLDPHGHTFLLSLISCWLASWMASAYGLALSTGIADVQVAMALVPIVIIPLLLVGGFYAPNQSVPDFFKIFEYISVFKYHYQTFVYAQFYDKQDGFTVNLNGKDYTYKGNIIGQGGRLYIQDPYWLGLFLMAIIGLVLRLIALGMMYIISNPKKLRLKEPQSLPQQQQNPTMINNYPVPLSGSYNALSAAYPQSSIMSGKPLINERMPLPDGINSHDYLGQSVKFM